MAAATTTTDGEIVLAGDLTGDANAPELRASGVTPGTYAPVQRMSVDSKGRITSVGQLTPTELSDAVGSATDTSKGVFCIGTGLSVSAGHVVVDVNSLTASAPATGSVFGFVKPGANITNTGGVFSIADATNSVKGVASYGAGLTITGAAVSADYSAISSNFTIATDSVFGAVKSGTNITNTAGVLSVVDATSSVNGVFTLGNGLTATAGVASLDFSTLPATGSVFGFVKSGGNITNTSGVLSIEDATSSVKGVASYGAGLTISSGAVSLDVSTVLANLTVATGSVFGLVKSGTNITNTAGVLSIEDATNSVKGVCSVDTSSGLSISAGAISITDVAKRDVANTYTVAQDASLTSTTLGGTTFTPNFQTDPASTLITLSGNLTINFPSTLAPTGCVVREDIILKYSTGGTYVVTLSGTYKTNGTLSFTNSNVNASDVLSLICTDTVCYAILNEKFQ